MFTYILAAVCIQQATAYAPRDQELLISRLPLTVFTPGEKRLFNAGRRYAEQVERLLIQDGHTSSSIRIAVLANAWHECKFDRTMSHVDSNNANTAGFFALNSKGVGYGMTVAQKQDIDTAYNRLFGRQATKDWLVRVLKRKWDAEDAARGYAAKVMVCAHQYRERPAQTAKKWEEALRKAGVLKNN